jgi:cytochrome P450
VFHPGRWLVVVTRYDGVEFVGTHPELFSAQLDDSPVDRTFGSPAIITVDGELRHELRHALEAKYRPRHVRAYIDDLVRRARSLPVFSTGWAGGTGPS